ncbi:MAG: UDP-N-acetylglucosamine 2-epimerase (non-hydrolyzing) [Verrucomicrobia bacterium]|nr:UDP-N-acetylglucosamine 2-epimerase (non-hydrolyzing) [Verrucomicrobiota bacterium]
MSTILVDGIVGARPNLMKMAPLARALAAQGRFSLRLIHTGQHYDGQMSDVFFRELGLPGPAHNLNVGSGPQGAQTARILEGYEQILLAAPRPRGVIVVGDVTSTLACALAAAKLCIPVAHVEAGLRSGDRTMPEEINRILTDALSDVLLVSDPDGLIHLAREGRPREKIALVGNIMMDTLHAELPRAAQSPCLNQLGLQPRQYAYLTLHRPSNVDNPAVLKRLVALLAEFSQTLPLVFSLHPRTRDRLAQAAIRLPEGKQFRVIHPLGYRDNLRMIQSARVVLTDSGGIQEETSVLNVPCLTLRDATERPVTVTLGSSELVGHDETRIRDAWNRLLAGRWKQASPIPLWDGHAAERIATRLAEAWA